MVNLVPSAVFIRVNVLPTGIVTVFWPFESEPPAIPIRAPLRFTETSWKKGCGAAAGNVLPTATVSEVPFTEITALVGGPAGAVDVVAPPGGGLGGAGVVGVVPVVVAAPVGVAPVALTCWTNGSLLTKRLKEMSFAVEAVTGESVWIAWPATTAVAAGAGAGPVPASVGGASVPGAGVTAAGAAAAGDGAVSVLGGFSCLSVLGSVKARIAASSTRPTTTKIFCRLAFAFGSNFLAIYPVAPDAAEASVGLGSVLVVVAAAGGAAVAGAPVP